MNSVKGRTLRVTGDGARWAVEVNRFAWRFRPMRTTQ